MMYQKFHEVAEIVQTCLQKANTVFCFLSDIVWNREFLAFPLHLSNTQQCLQKVSLTQGVC